jgi:hypothetical protein
MYYDGYILKYKCRYFINNILIIYTHITIMPQLLTEYRSQMLSQTIQHPKSMLYMLNFYVDLIVFFVLNFTFKSIVLLGFFFTF